MVTVRLYSFIPPSHFLEFFSLISKRKEFPKMNREQPIPVRSFKTKKPKFYRKGPPFCLSNFVLIGELGQGAFGQVYNVYDKEKGYRVAMKVARPIHTAAIGHEIEVVTKLAGLDVRNIVELHGTGTCDLLDNRLFYAMRVEDGTLQSFIDNDNTLDGPSFFFTSL